MHSSRSFLVSGQAQQIFFFGLVSGPAVTADPCFCDEARKVKAEEAFSVGNSLILTRPLENTEYWREEAREQKMKSKD